MEKIEFRLAITSDKHSIADLLSLASKHLRPIHYWDWINTKKIFPGSFVVLAIHMGKIVGHYAVSVREFNIFGKLEKVGLATQTVIHPAYRRLQILLDISNFTRDICVMRNLHMVLGFPNNNLHKINKKLLKWQYLADITQLEIDLNNLINHNPQFQKERVIKFDERFNNLIKFYNTKNNNIKEYLTIENLNWRYFEHPLNNYAIFASFDKKNLVKGYIALKLYHSDIGLKGHVMEIVTFDNLSEIDVLFGFAISYFKWANCDSISLWSINNDYKYNYFKKMGFKENSITSHLQVLTLSESSKEFVNIDNLDVCMKMSDAY